MHVDSISFGECIAAGLFDNITPVSKLGNVTGVEASEVDIWSVGGTYVFPAAAQQMEVVSSSAADNPSSTGAWTVKIWYLDSSFKEKTETITLNGQTAVPTKATDIYRINNFWVITAGTGKKAAGNIDIRNLSDTPIYSRIPIGLTRARNSIYTVPYGKKFYISQITYGSSTATGKDSRFTFRANYNEKDGIASALFYPYSEIGIQDTTFTITYVVPMMFPAGTDMKTSVISASGAAAICSVQYRGYFVR